MNVDSIITVLGLIGIGGIVKSTIDYAIQLLKTKSDSKHQLKETRYKAILLLCYTYVHYEKEGVTLIINRPDIRSSESLLQELITEWNNMMLYSTDFVFLKMKSFLERKDKDSYNELILGMRRDLYGIRTKIRAKDFHLNS